MRNLNLSAKKAEALYSRGKKKRKIYIRNTDFL